MGIPCPWNITSLILMYFGLFWYFALINPSCFGLFRGHHHSGEHSSTALSCSGAICASTAFQARCLCAMAVSGRGSLCCHQELQDVVHIHEAMGLLVGSSFTTEDLFPVVKVGGQDGAAAIPSALTEVLPVCCLPVCFHTKVIVPPFTGFCLECFGSQAKSRLWIDVVHSWFLPEACFLGEKTNRRSRNRRCHLHR